MIDNLTILNDHWALPVSVAAILLLAVFLWKEWAQTGKHRFVLKAILAILAVAALVLIALKPALPIEETTGKMVLLTEGYKAEKLDSLKKENKRLRQLQYLPGEPLSDELNSAEEVYVLGHGLKEYDLWQLDGVSAVYIEGDALEGVVELNYEQEQSIGENLILNGLYKSPDSGNQLFLNGPGGTALDSITLSAEGEQKFRLAAELNVAGNYVYSLVEKDPLGEIIRSDPVPVKVTEKDNLKVLVVNSFPTFETKYLKNFLSEAGHEVVVRSQITRGRFIFEYFNTNRVAVNNLSETTLEAFDLLIIDAATLRTLPGSQINGIESSIRTTGLGLFIQPDDALFNSSGKLYPLKFERVPTTEITDTKWPGVKLTTFPYRIRDDFAIQPIQTSENSLTSAYKRTGQGRIGTTVWANTWQLVLDGQGDVYKELWSQIAEQISKKKNPAAEWQQEAMIAYRDEPFYFVIRTTISEPAVTSNFGIIPLIQHPDFPEVWSGTTWPRESGWNSLNQDTTATFDYYVADDSHWSSLYAYKTRQVNFNNLKSSVAAMQGHKPLEPVNPLWFYFLFLLCIGGLWLEPKL